jgi:PIN domain nuclease of toxin-antitoxin system
MPRALWQLLLEDPSDLTCDECFAVMEYYAEALTRGGVDLLPEIIEHLKRCPDCKLQHRQALRRLMASQSERRAAPLTDATEFDGSDAKGQQHQ